MKYTILALVALLVACQAVDDLENVVTTDENEPITKDDGWEADSASWNPEAEDTREGGGNSVGFDGQAVVENKLQVFEGRDAELSLAAEKGYGGAARGNAPRHNGDRKRNLKALRGNHK